MKILWTCNILFPETAKFLGLEPTPFGGWLPAMAQQIVKNKDISLTVISPCRYVNKIYKYDDGIIKYYIIPDRDKGIYKDCFVKILEEIKPDIVDINGTEELHSLAMGIACKLTGTPFVLSIQGLVSVFSSYFESGLPHKIIKKGNINNTSIFYFKQKYEIDGANEKLLIGMSENIMGRTEWDKANVKIINPLSNYHHVGRILRNEFYVEDLWSIEKCERHSIFIGQFSLPIKGFHFFLKAISMLVKKYPDLSVYVLGGELDNNPWKHMENSYQDYINGLIDTFGLRKHIIFAGFLTANKIREYMLRSNVFVLSSSIENSPNTLGEAMMLGVPCVASMVGGVPSMLTHEKEGYLFQYDAECMLAYYVEKIFDDDDLAKKLSFGSHARAIKNHDREKNSNDLIKVYQEVFGAKRLQVQEERKKYNKLWESRIRIDDQIIKKNYLGRKLMALMIKINKIIYFLKR